ncbi:hypothetical protein MNB_SV-9-1635 [hydrothermal vent metagenome]|uniref:Tetratricopeptide repeat-like domain-containing protein n=1 Tax=hydrothermal vent metagenome TaxID=652676 RepID=A0A1W1C1D0_9ZZZZ
MNIKDNVDYVKNELTADEKVLESAFKLENIYRKYKILIWGVVGILVIGGGSKVTLDIIHQSKLDSANKALITLQTEPNNAEAKKILKENNPALFDLYSFKSAIKSKDIKALDVLSKDKNNIIADISAYHSRVLSNKNGESIYYKNLALVSSAYSDIENNKTKDARLKLEMIDNRSSLASISTILTHYTIKGE